MADLKPAYLIHGDDHGAVAERRARLRELAEREGGADSVESLDGESATPEGVAGALAAMTLALGWRVILVEGVERWKQAEVEQHLTPAMGTMPPETTIALFAREEGRAKAPAAVHQAVRRAGGQVVEQGTVKPWELPKWVRAQATRMGIELDAAAAAALVGQVGERQQRLVRELEKLALEQESPGTVSVQDIEGRAARSAEYRAYTLADALVGADAREATRAYLRLREQGERLARTDVPDGIKTARSAPNRHPPAGGRVRGRCQAWPAHAPARGGAVRQGRSPDRSRAAAGRAGCAGRPGARYTRGLTAAGGTLADVGTGRRHAGAASDRVDHKLIGAATGDPNCNERSAPELRR